MSLTFQQLQDRMKQILSFMADIEDMGVKLNGHRADLNEMEKTYSRLKTELKEAYDELDARLNGENP